MIVREAKVNDVTPLVRLCQKFHGQSEYRWLPFSAAAMRRSIQEMRRRVDCVVLVADQDGEIKGFLFGTVDQFLYNRKLYATDVEFMAEAGGAELLEAFKEWAESRGAAVEIHGVSNAEQDETRAKAKDRWFTAQGLTKTGGMFQRSLQ